MNLPGALAALSPLTIWLGGDLAHYLWVAARQARWERTLTRDTRGLRRDAAPFSRGNPEAPALLMIHGFADIPATLLPMAEALAAGGLHVRVMRLPGAGEPLAAAAAVRLEDWLDAVADELRALRASGRPVWLLGHSLGGALALATALRQPQDVAGLVLLSPLLRVSRRRSPLLPPAVWFRLARIAFPFSRRFESCFSGDVWMTEGCDFHYRRDRFIPFATYRNLFALCDWLQPRAGALPMPLLAFLAGNDAVVDSAAAGDWLRRCITPRQVVRLLPDAAHALQSGPAWKEVTESLRSFMLEP